MAKMGGCNYEHNNSLGSQGKGRVTTGDSARNNLKAGGVNGHAGGSDKFDHKPGLGKGKNGTGKYRHDAK